MGEFNYVTYLIQHAKMMKVHYKDVLEHKSIILITVFAAAIRFSLLDASIRYPDAIHYLWGAESILQRGRYLVFGDIPPQYPFGFSALIAVFFALFGMKEVIAEVCVALFGVLSIPLIYFLGYEMTGDKRVGLVSGLFLTFCSIHWLLSETIMSDVPSFFFSALSIALVLKGTRTQNNLYLVLSGLVASFSVMVRLSNILIFLPLFALLLMNKKLKPLAIFTSSSLVSSIPLAWFYYSMYVTYHFLTGYTMYMGQELFWRQALTLGNMMSGLGYYARAFLSFSIIPPEEHALWYFGIMTFLFLCGIAFMNRRMKTISILWFLPYVLFYSCFYVPDTRYVLPAVAPFTLTASYGLIKLHDLTITKHRKVTNFITVLTVLTIVLISFTNVYERIYVRHTRPSESVAAINWFIDNAKGYSILITGLGEESAYYLRNTDKQMRYIGSMQNISEIKEWLFQNKEVYVTYDYLTFTYYQNTFDDIRKFYNLTLVHNTGVHVYKITEK